jgi:5'-3' exonuclease
LIINYKLLMGDAGDNVPGVQGLGPKKLIKLSSQLSPQTLTVLPGLLAEDAQVCDSD